MFLMSEAFLISKVPGIAYLQGYLAHKNTPTPLGPPQNPTHIPTVGSYGGLFLISEVPLLVPTLGGWAFLISEVPTIVLSAGVPRS